MGRWAPCGLWAVGHGATVWGRSVVAQRGENARDSVLQLDSAAADRNTETVSANSAAGWRRFLACLDSLLAGVDACDLAALQFI